MRAIYRQVEAGWPSTRGAPFAAITLLPLPIVGPAATLSGLILAALCMFTLFMPVMAIAYGAVAEDADVPLTSRRYGVLLVLWVFADLGGTLLQI
ncbi:MAG: hypothetical protein JO227_25170 [Acetobacteraceae bacterium]|nr:hypothetical protein [Acetobacteraceae bacterium]